MRKTTINLKFMGPCIVRIFQYISNKMQRYTVYFIWKLLYMFQVVLPPFIKSANNCIYSIWYLSHRYCYLPLSWKSWNWFQCADSLRAGSGWNGVPSWSCCQAVRIPVWYIPLLCLQWKTPDDGQRNCPKHVEFYSKNKFEKLVHLVGFISLWCHWNFPLT